MRARWISFTFFSVLLFPFCAYSQIIYEIDGSSTSDAPYDRSYSVDDNSSAYYEDSGFNFQMNALPSEALHEIDSSPYSHKNAPLPSRIRPHGEKLVLVDPNEHAWGAYSAEGALIRWGIATAGGNWCRDINRPCRTKSGIFRIYSSGDETCISTKFPIPDGGAPMPYCMYFNGGQALHGSNEVVYANVSHGCVRLHVGDAKWLRYQFVEGPNARNNYRGTKVLVKPY